MSEKKQRNPKVKATIKEGQVYLEIKHVKVHEMMQIVNAMKQAIDEMIEMDIVSEMEMED